MSLKLNHPDEYSKMAYDHSMKPGNVITEDLPLPMSAEELFQALKNPLRTLSGDFCFI